MCFAQSNILPGEHAQNKDILNSVIPQPVEGRFQPETPLQTIPKPDFKEPDYNKSSMKATNEDPVEKLMNSLDKKKPSWETQYAQNTSDER